MTRSGSAWRARRQAASSPARSAQAKASFVQASHPTILPHPSAPSSAFKPNQHRRPKNGRRGHPTRLPKVAGRVRRRKCGEQIVTLLSHRFLRCLAPVFGPREQFAGSLLLAEGDRLGALPEGQLAQGGQLLLPLHDRGEVVRPELARLRREVAVAVREEQLGLALATGVQGELAGVGVRRRVFRADAQVAVAPRDPVRLAAPAAVDDPVLEGEDGAECGDRLRRQLLLEVDRKSTRLNSSHS